MTKGCLEFKYNQESASNRLGDAIDDILDIPDNINPKTCDGVFFLFIFFFSLVVVSIIILWWKLLSSAKHACFGGERSIKQQKKDINFLCQIVNAY